MGGPKAQRPRLMGVSTRAQARGHRGRGWGNGAGGTRSQLGEVQLGVRDEHHRGGGHLPGNAREWAAHRDGGAA
jgi:hypothetical protein